MGSRTDFLLRRAGAIPPTFLLILSTGAIATAAEENSSNTDPSISEVIVTAEKKEERIQNVPIPVTVLNTEALTQNGQVLLRDYYLSVPGLNVSQGYINKEPVSIRGINIGDSNPTVAITIDDVPYTGATDALNNGNALDVDPGDLARIEVLRGPQGTLYGSNAMGGMIKYVTKDPSTEAFSARIETGTSFIDHASHPGFDFRGSVNMPVSESFAVRVSAYSTDTPGYIDNPIYHLKDVNQASSSGVTITGFYRPWDSASLKISGSYQERTQDGSNEYVVAPGLTGLQQNYIPGSHIADTSIAAFSAVFKARLGEVDLTSVTGLNKYQVYINDDRSAALGSFIQDYYGYENSNALIDYHQHYQNFSQELRFNGTLFTNLEWLVGGLFLKETNPVSVTRLFGFTDAGALITNPIFYEFQNVPAPEFREYAGFANLTYNFSERFKLQLGARESFDHNNVGGAVFTGPGTEPLVGGVSPVTTPDYGANTSVFTYLVSPQFKITPDIMAYIRIANGYRPGGGNFTTLPDEPARYSPDKTTNYEIGLKGDFFDKSLSLDLSVYHIKWKNIQITEVNSNSFYFITNAGNAKSEGIELEATVRPASGLTINGWVSYDHAVLTEDFPVDVVAAGTFGLAGDRLPQSARWSGNLSAEQDMHLFEDKTGFVQGKLSYIGDRLGNFPGSSTGARQVLPEYTTLDLAAGVRWDSWETRLYARNATNRVGILNGGIGYRPSDAFAIIQPRTIGIGLSKKF